MIREFSAGGLVIRRVKGQWWLAVIEPRRDPDRKPAKVLALPKGLLAPGEKPDETARREVLEETGLEASRIKKLGDVKYVYVRSWGDKQRIFKIVSFFLFKYQSGEIDDLSKEMRIEVAKASWIPLNEAASSLTYKGEREMAQLAREHVLALEGEALRSTLKAAEPHR